MNSFPEALYKSTSVLTFGWNPEPNAGVATYSLYAGQTGDSTGSLTLLTDVIPNSASSDPRYAVVRKISYDVTIDAIRSALGISSSIDFSTLVLYFALTYTDPAGAISSFSKIVEVPPVGITGKTMKEDPSTNRHIFGFSDELQRWIKVAASGNGALIIEANDFYRANTVTDYTRDSSGNALTERIYFSDRTSSGSPAKFITNSYNALGQLTKTVIIDSTVA